MKDRKQVSALCGNISKPETLFLLIESNSSKNLEEKRERSVQSGLLEETK